MQPFSDDLKHTFFCFSHLASRDWRQLQSASPVLVSMVESYIFRYNLGGSEDSHPLPGLRPAVRQMEVGGGAPGRRWLEILMLQQKVVLQVLDRLRLCAHRAEFTSSPQQQQRPLLADLRRVIAHLELAVYRLVELTLQHELRGLTDLIRNFCAADGSSFTPARRTAVIAAVNALIDLGSIQADEQLVYGAIENVRAIEGVVALVRRTSQWREARLLGLRAISSLCCRPAAIRWLEEAGGVPVVADLLVAGTNLEVRVEAAGVLAQITSPWLAENHQVGGLASQLLALVGSLTGLAALLPASHGAGGQVEDSLLLVTAALANLSFMEPAGAALEAMAAQATARILVDKMEAASSSSLFVRDQVVTVLANMAATRDGRHEVVDLSRGLEFLVNQLLITKIGDHSSGATIVSFHSPAEMEAAERILKKAAIALCRLCEEADCRAAVEARGGRQLVQRLVQLCQEPVARNGSDSVLVASLALLRRLGRPAATEQTDGRLNLLQENLMDSFRELSSQQESYV